MSWSHRATEKFTAKEKQKTISALPLPEQKSLWKPKFSWAGKREPSRSWRDPESTKLFCINSTDSNWKWEERGKKNVQIHTSQCRTPCRPKPENVGCIQRDLSCGKLLSTPLFQQERVWISLQKRCQEILGPFHVKEKFSIWRGCPANQDQWNAPRKLQNPAFRPGKSKNPKSTTTPFPQSLVISNWRDSVLFKRLQNTCSKVAERLWWKD